MLVFLRIFFWMLVCGAFFSVIQDNFLFFIISEMLLLGAFLIRTSRNLVIPDISESEDEYPLVSIIVPMRNEEKNAEECLRSLSALEYPHFEIIIGNDSSIDRTKEILIEVSRYYPIIDSRTITIVDVPSVPHGWTGKAWVVHKLMQRAKGSIVLVTDADVRHAPKSLKHSVLYFLKSRADLMVRFPYPITKTAGECLNIFLSFLLKFSAWFSMQLLGRRQALAKEEYVMFSKKFYSLVRGYGAFKNDYPMISALLNSAFDLNTRVTIVDDDSGEIKARMYDGFWRTVGGISERINFRSIRFFPFLGIFSVVSFATDGIFRVISGILVHNNFLLWSGFMSYVIFALLFSIYLHFSHYPMSGFFLAPLFGLFMAVMSLFAIARSIIKQPLHWRGRMVYTR